ncbi:MULTISPECIES: HDOD domain-containing protein [unclassified Oleiphilus]|uniref:HDOD domain-containing protein n=2 Tax=Oleiphilus TaxID=141450 RepID=UPI0007C20DD1|nr:MULTISPECIES: HDOD domain-containing protein [unclassified Oleiphilus]KZY42142.1 signal transduction protein [Oleiphilus sp. HI0050]KZY77556.1 signal transduction protein [Oleiphilus sp. HI0068]KZY77573.1 signal transduction protein [Oleiphilus sp. HI0069]KZZ08264.1 signal transduction protein [Oleiphilus sp. HI0078]KZZ21085.1 signal transduction protein [Oleiphilus sp. HI0081]
MSLESLFKGSPNLPNIPKVVQELIKQFNDPHSNVDEISKKIQMDQVLSAKIMRLANSARYGAGRKIASIDSAVVMLGIDTLKTLVVASGITGAFQDIPGFDKKQFWRDSFMIASISKLIAKHTDSDPETAFTIGMMRNIGELLIHIYHEESAVKIDKLVESGANRIDLQDNQFGYDFTQAGSELAKRWNFPTEIVNGIRQQAAPNDFEEYSAYSSIVYLADYLNEAFKAEQEKQEILSQFPVDIAKPIDINLVSFFEELVELAEAEDDIEELLKD